MAEKDKDIPVKEQDDGSALVKVEPHEQDEFEKDSTKMVRTEMLTIMMMIQTIKTMTNMKIMTHEESADEREKIREARREERRLKKELAKQREVSAKHKISSLEKRNQDLADRLARLESGAASLRLSQIDKQVEDEATRVEYAKMKMLQAAQANDVASQVEYLEQLTDAKQRLAQMQHYKQQQLEAAKRQPQNVPTPITVEVQENANSWLKKNSWYDPQARDTDSRIAKVVDQARSRRMGSVGFRILGQS